MSRKTRLGARMALLALGFFIAALWVASSARAQEVAGTEEYRLIAEGPNWTLYEIAGESTGAGKMMSRFDFNFTVNFPGNSWEVNEEGTLSWNALNGTTAHMQWIASSNPQTAFTGTFNGISSKTIDVTPTSSGEYRFQLRGEECTTFSGTECYRTKLLIVQVGPANQNVPPTAFDVTVEGNKGETICADAQWQDPDTPESRLRFEVVTAPTEGTVTDDDGDKRFCYQAPADFVGSKNVVYQIDDLDAQKFSNPATITFRFKGQVNVAEITRFDADRTTIQVGESVNLTTEAKFFERCFGEGGPSAWDTKEFAADPNGTITETFTSGVFNQTGSHTLEVMCRAGSVERTRSLVITVQQAPQTDLECSELASFTMNEGGDRNTKTSCNVPVTGTLVVSGLTVNGSTTKPSWITVAVNGNEVEFRFRPPAGSAGQYRLRGDITSPDRSGPESFDFTVTVVAQNQTPVCAVSDLAVSTQAGTFFTRTFGVTDANDSNSALTTSKTGLSFVQVSNVVNNQVTLTGAPGHGLVGTHSGVITVQDPSGGSCSVNVTITVTAVQQNQPPVCTVNMNPNAVAGQPYSFTVVPTDEEGHRVQATLVNPPSGMTITPTTLQPSGTTFTGNWPNPVVGQHIISVQCIDEMGADTTVTNSVTVTDGTVGECQDPEWHDHNQRNVPLTIHANGVYDYTLDVSAPDGNVSLSFDQENEATWLQLSGKRIHGTAPNVSGRTDKVRIRATNSSGGCQTLLVWNISTMTNVGTEKDGELPQVATLYQNYPNPFNPAATIPFALPKSSHVRIVIYDMMGREKQVVVDEVVPAGHHEAKVDISQSGWPSGVYNIQLQADGRVANVQMTLMK